MLRFIFDLDGTITTAETLPVIAGYFHMEKDMKGLTDAAVAGGIPFIESFIKRVHIMAKLPVDEIDALLEMTPMYPEILKFIREHRTQCMIATGNLGCWVKKLCTKAGCIAYTSQAEIENNQVVRLKNILRKEHIVKRYQSAGDKVVMIGEGNNDLEAMRQADISIASGLTHNPAGSVLGIADYVIYKEEALCRQLNQLL